MVPEYCKREQERQQDETDLFSRLVGDVPYHGQYKCKVKQVNHIGDESTVVAEPTGPLVDSPLLPDFTPSSFTTLSPNMTTNTTLPVPMPIPGTRDAPHFNGKLVTDFLNRVKLHGEAAGIIDHNNLVNYIYQYSSYQVKEYIRYLPEFDIELKSMFASADVEVTFTEDSLTSYAKTHTDEYSFTSQKDVEAYYLGFQKIAAPLIKKGLITDKRSGLAFTKDIPHSLRNWFTNAIPEANRTIDNPPQLEASRKVLLGKFDKKSLFYEPSNTIKKGPPYDRKATA
ncbi:hypothetical protein PQX77_009127 [Marasmius sp. AFHP31]|nr:hypothetical protein PQX77_009127 [Marasmius sp. AFHP31]